MIVLDTNVISEPLKPAPEAKVLSWLDAQAVETLYLPTPVLAEMLTGIARLPEGKRRRGMEQIVEVLQTEFIGPRFLPFDIAAALRHSELSTQAERRGVILSFADCQIAAIASVHGFAVATRDTAPFVAVGLEVINPWLAL